jgi:formate-dependent phosphoribosylglycinamide formyltransferase (GAR transformylase)
VSIAVLHEHPKWNDPLFAELDRRGLDWVSVDAFDSRFDPTAIGDWAVLVNRMSPSAWTRGNATAMFQTADFLRDVEARGIPVINGSESFAYEMSKAKQLDLLRQEQIRHPEGRAVMNSGEIVAAACDLTFPVLVKPNIGGSGAGITEHETLNALADAVASGMLDDLGPDGTAIVQEKVPAMGDSIVRIEILGGEFLYAIRLQLQPGSFNLCPADYCDPATGGTESTNLVESYVPPDDLIAHAVRIIESIGADLGGVEYLVSTLDGEAYFYDINSLSNFVADAPNVIGFDPFVHLVDLIVDRAQRLVPA